MIKTRWHLWKKFFCINFFYYYYYYNFFRCLMDECDKRIIGKVGDGGIICIHKVIGIISPLNSEKFFLFFLFFFYIIYVELNF